MKPALHLLICFFLTVIVQPAIAGHCAAGTRAPAATAVSTPGRATVMMGLATYYTLESCRREGTSGIMANGQILNERAMTCAIWRPGKPSGQRYRVTNSKNGKSVIVRWTDRGPGRKSRSQGIIIDLTPAAFLAIGGKLKNGKIRIKLQVMK
jgi:rare lipoprotein A